jgi:hypothetical protein
MAKLEAAFETSKLATGAKVLPSCQHCNMATDQRRQVLGLKRTNLQNNLL